MCPRQKEQQVQKSWGSNKLGSPRKTKSVYDCSGASKGRVVGLEGRGKRAHSRWALGSQETTSNFILSVVVLFQANGGF